MNILLVISELGFGGAERQVVQIANNLRGHEVHIASLSEFVPLAKELKNRDRLHIVEKHGRFDVSVAWRIAKLIERLRINVCHGFLFDADIACRLARALTRSECVFVASERNADYEVRPFKLFVQRVTRRLTDGCVANSERGAQFYRARYGERPERTLVVRNGVDTRRFREYSCPETRRALGLGPEHIVIGMFASFKKQKNHLHLLRSITNTSLPSRLPNVRFLFVGEALHAARNENSQLGNRIHDFVAENDLSEICLFVGNQRRVERFYAACDFTVLPSLHEGTPNTVLESMAVGKPVIANRVADNAAIITDGVDGLLVSSEDEKGLAEAMLRMAVDEELRVRCGARARERVVTDFSNDVMCSNLMRAYCTLGQLELSETDRMA